MAVAKERFERTIASNAGSVLQKQIAVCAMYEADPHAHAKESVHVKTRGKSAILNKFWEFLSFAIR